MWRRRCGVLWTCCGPDKVTLMGALALPPQTSEPVADVLAAGSQVAVDERAARRSLRHQIARLERELADAFVTAFPMGGLDQPPAIVAHPRLLGLGELESVRDDLAQRLHDARVTITRRADEQAEKRLLLERVRLAPR